MAKNIRDRRLDRPADESIEMSTLEVMEEEEDKKTPEMIPRGVIQCCREI